MDKIDHEWSWDGLHTRTYTDEATGKMLIRKDQDISAAIEYATKLRNADQYSSDGIKKNFMHVCTIPRVVVSELKTIGIDIFTADAKELAAGLKALHKEHLMVTRKHV